jgi:4-amino-4-deoxy-L-arabinose transferase-like glycosyltransferase
MPEKTLNHSSQFKRAAPFLFVAVVALLAAIIVNPIRQFLGTDDSWFYARMVEYTLATGKYRMDPFTAANPPVHTYLSAGIAKLFGYSFGLLHCVTLAFLFLAISSFYLLLRELGHSRKIAALVTLVFLASPLVLILSFAYMSDIPFIAWMLLALLLYVRGIRRNSTSVTFLGSLAAGCAIGTRQFGVAIVGGLVAVWLFSRTRPRTRLMLAALAIPLLAGIAQVYVGIKYPNPIQAGCIVLMHRFYQLPLHIILEEYFWRCSMIVQYLGIALLPLLPLAFALPRSVWKERIHRIPVWIIGLLACASIIAALSLSSLQSARPEARHHGAWEPLELQWVLAINFVKVRPVMRLLDTAGILGGATLIVLALYKLQPKVSLRSFRPATLLLLGTCVSLFFLYLPFSQLNDTYTVEFLPFVLLLIADALQNHQPPPNVLRAAAAFSTLIVLATAFWMRGEAAPREAEWASADALYHAGVQPINMVVPYDWSQYHGGFDEWAAQDPSSNQFDFLSRGWGSAQFAVQYAPSPAAPPGWRLLAVRDYRNVTFQRRYVLTLERDPVR